MERWVDIGIDLIFICGLLILASVALIVVAVVLMAIF
jgi:hypothetical protein